MNSKLQKQFKLLENARAEMKMLVSPMNEMNFKRTIGNKWSAGQILIHIITSEKLALQYMRKKTLGLATLKNSGFIEPVKLTVLKISQRLPIRYKVPKAIREKTPAPTSKEDVLQAWEKSRLELKAFLESIGEENIDKLIFKHPIAGMFNVTQGVAFLREHLLHHRPQVVRLTKTSFSAEQEGL